MTTLLTGWVVGQTMTRHQMLEDAPVGTVIQGGRNNYEFTKLESGRWLRTHDGQTYGSGNFNGLRENDMFITALPYEWVVGRVLTTQEEIRDAPVGMIATQSGGRWTKRADGRLHYGEHGGGLAWNDFQISPSIPLVMVGMDATEQAAPAAAPAAYSVGDPLRSHDAVDYPDGIVVTNTVNPTLGWIARDGAWCEVNLTTGRVTDRTNSKRTFANIGARRILWVPVQVGDVLSRDDWKWIPAGSEGTIADMNWKNDAENRWAVMPHGAFISIDHFNPDQTMTVVRVGPEGETQATATPAINVGDAYRSTIDYPVGTQVSHTNATRCWEKVGADGWRVKDIDTDVWVTTAPRPAHELLGPRTVLRVGPAPVETPVVAQSNVGDRYSPEVTYPVGTQVTYIGANHRCWEKHGDQLWHLTNLDGSAVGYREVENFLSASARRLVLRIGPAPEVAPAINVGDVYGSDVEYPEGTLISYIGERSSDLAWMRRDGRWRTVRIDGSQARTSDQESRQGLTVSINRTVLRVGEGVVETEAPHVGAVMREEWINTLPVGTRLNYSMRGNYTVALERFTTNARDHFVKTETAWVHGNNPSRNRPSVEQVRGGEWFITFMPEVPVGAVGELMRWELFDTLPVGSRIDYDPMRDGYFVAHRRFEQRDLDSYEKREDGWHYNHTYSDRTLPDQDQVDDGYWWITRVGQPEPEAPEPVEPEPVVAAPVEPEFYSEVIGAAGWDALPTGAMVLFPISGNLYVKHADGGATKYKDVDRRELNLYEMHDRHGTHGSRYLGVHGEQVQVTFVGDTQTQLLATIRDQLSELSAQVQEMQQEPEMPF